MAMVHPVLFWGHWAGMARYCINGHGPPSAVLGSLAGMARYCINGHGPPSAVLWSLGRDG